MDEHERNLRSEDSGTYSDRSEKVRNFHVHIDDDVGGFGDMPYAQNQPVYKGEVYFSNHSRKSAVQEPVQTPRPVEPRRPQPVQTRQTTKPTGTKKKKKKKKVSYLTATAKVLISVFLCTALLSGIGISAVNDILAINRSSEPVAVEIPDDATTEDVIHVLAKEGLVKRPLICKLFYKVENKIRSAKKEPVYVSGIVTLKASMGLEGMLNRVKENQQLTETVTLYFPEGWSAKQIFDKLEKYGVCEADYLYKTIQNSNFNESFLSSAKLADSDARYLLWEGYLFPDTYEFFVDNNASSVLKRFLDRFGEIWTDEYQQRADELGYSVDEIIRIASIIQREAANEEQMTQVSSVLHNRLNNPTGFPTLDCDSTYNYIDNYVTPVVGESLGAKYRQAYNTYACPKLPAGPICNPGEAAIRAALYPDDTDYYYFQHDKQGNIYLARTNAEHNRYKTEIALRNAG